MPTATKKFTAVQILQRTINDFTRHPERWTQNDFGRDPKKDADDVEDTKLWSLFNDETKKAREAKLTVKQPGNGDKGVWDLFGLDPYDLIGEAQLYCGLGGVEQNAWRLNKAHFWDASFQYELIWVGAYLEWMAQKQINPGRNHWDGSPYHFEGFVDFNDANSTTVKEVIALMKETLVHLKKRDAANAAKRAKRAAAKVS